MAGQGDPNEEHGLQGAAAAVNYEDEDIECDDVDTGFVEEEKRAGVTEMKECGTSPFRESNAAGDKTCQDEVCHMEHQQVTSTGGRYLQILGPISRISLL